MHQIAAMRLAAPDPFKGEILRTRLIDRILNNDKRIIFVQGGAGYGKTTLLSQSARTHSDFIWLTLDGESEVFQFLNGLSAAVRRIYPSYQFPYSDYVLLESKNNFTNLLADALIQSLEALSAEAGQVLIVLDDIHTITGIQIQELLTRLLKYLPASLRIYLGSREAVWPQLVPLVLHGRIEEISQQELSFTREETDLLLGRTDTHVYELTEGWPLAVRSYQLMSKDGSPLPQPLHRQGQRLYAYLFRECIGGLSAAVHHFLYVTSCFDSLDPPMINAVLSIVHSDLILETLVSRNLFTTRSANGHYRYHTLFQEFLVDQLDPHEKIRYQHQAAMFYLKMGEHHKAADYALKLSDTALLADILLHSYRELIKQGDFSTLSHWFQRMEEGNLSLAPPLLIAKGVLLSSMGNFLEAKTCLDQAIPLLSGQQQEEAGESPYLEAMVHKARVLRNSDSFDSSNDLLDQLISRLPDFSTESAYSVIIEKIYNLCWGSRIREAFALSESAVDACNRSGNYRVRSWYQRYLAVIEFLSGNMKKSVAHYEDSLSISKEDQQILSLHSIGYCAAKAYQMLGQRELSLKLINGEISRIRSAGQFEELYLAYLFAAEIHYQNAFIDQMNGIPQQFEDTIHYFELANEYAPLYRTSDFQLRWARIHQLAYSLIFTKGPNEELVSNIFSILDQVEDYFKTTTLARLFSYYGALGDFQNAVKCAQQCIQIGERAGLMMLPILSYGILARATLARLQTDPEQLEPAIRLVRHYLQLCSQYGIYEYFKLRSAYDPILEFARTQGIEPEITTEIMEFAGYHEKKVKIETFGGLAVRRIGESGETLKMRSKKVRELLAFLLYVGERGATKEQIRYALWSESESEDVKKLIGVTLSHLKTDLSRLGIKNPLVKQGNHYSIDRSELQVDDDLFLLAIQEFQKNKTLAEAQKILAIYNGEYLPEIQSFWVLGNRLRYREIYENALHYIESEEGDQVIGMQRRSRHL